MSTGEMMAAGKYLEAMEKELYTKFLNLLDCSDWTGCGEVVDLLKGLSII